MNTEIYDKAHAIMTQRRSAALTENNRRINEINEKIPEIKEINTALFNTGKELIRAITESHGGDQSARIEEIKQRNLGAQQFSRKLLTEHGYPADYLDMHYSCPHCSDTGYIGSNFCICMKQLFAKLSADRINQNSPLKLSSFDTFRLDYYNGEDREMMERILRYTVNYANTFSLDSDSILIFGNTGLGKTHISLAIANVVLGKGYSVIYDCIINILRQIEQENFSRERSSEMLDLVTETDLLILDDLGTEYESKFYASTIYYIVNTRLSRGKPTIINTNFGFEEIDSRYGGKVASRITTMYKCLNFRGEDIRFRLSQNNPQNN